MTGRLKELKFEKKDRGIVKDSTDTLTTARNGKEDKEARKHGNPRNGLTQVSTDQRGRPSPFHL